MEEDLHANFKMPVGDEADPNTETSSNSQFKLDGTISDSPYHWAIQ